MSSHVCTRDPEHRDENGGREKVKVLVVGGVVRGGGDGGGGDGGGGVCVCARV